MTKDEINRMRAEVISRTNARNGVYEKTGLRQKLADVDANDAGAVLCLKEEADATDDLTRKATEDGKELDLETLQEIGKQAVRENSKFTIKHIPKYWYAIVILVIVLLFGWWVPRQNCIGKITGTNYTWGGGRYYGGGSEDFKTRNDALDYCLSRNSILFGAW